MSLPAFHCGHYGTGHDVHHIRALHAEREHTYVPAEVLDIDGEYITFATDGAIHRGWNHDPARLATLLGEGPAQWSQEYRLLKLGGFVFGLDSEEDYAGCESFETHGATTTGRESTEEIAYIVRRALGDI